MTIAMHKKNNIYGDLKIKNNLASFALNVFSQFGHLTSEKFSNWLIQSANQLRTVFSRIL